MNTRKNYIGVLLAAVVAVVAAFGVATPVRAAPVPHKDDPDWTLVRRVQSGNNWHPATDHLTGTDVYGTPGVETANVTFSVDFETAVPGWDQALMITGDRDLWMVMDRTEIAKNGNPANFEVLASSEDPSGPTYPQMYHRAPNAEDPWLSLVDHATAVGAGKILYGGNSFNGAHATNVLPVHNGANVFIRKLVLTQVSLSTDVLNEGSGAAASYSDGYNNNGTNSTVEMIRFIPHSDASPINVVYNQNSDTIDVSQFVVEGAERGAGQGLKSNGYSTSGGTPGGNLYLRGQPNQPNEGFGAHANWIITFDLDDIRTEHMGGTSAPLNLTGDFGIWGGASSPVEAQGVVYLDGVRIDSMPEATAAPVNQSFDLDITSGRWLTFGIFNGDGTGDNTTWDDAVFQNVQLTVIPEPSAIVLLGFGLAALAFYSRRRK